jgi:hypothetical protein
MRKTMGAGALAAVALALSLPPAQGVEGEEVNRAIENGVRSLRTMQRADGSWPAHGNDSVSSLGATALAGLTLLECNVRADDPSVAAAAKHLREKIPDCRYTYALALGILFLDRLGDPKDVPLIEVMAVRLLAGQGDVGGWSYQCPEAVSAQEVQTLLKRQAELIDRRQLPRVREGGPSVNDLPALIQDRLKKILRARPESHSTGGDNANTQFAALGLWVARRYGIPVEMAIARMEHRFRATQNPDGGWPYHGVPPGTEDSTPTMTCAGILALEISRGLVGEGKKPRDPAKDQQLAAGLKALGTCIGGPKQDVPQKDDKFYYFVWSVERVCVIMDLKTLRGTDWYKWGAAILINSQGADGQWPGEFADCGADTCFALLFLKRANLARDLGKRPPGDEPLRAKTRPAEARVPVPQGGEPVKEKTKPAEPKALPELGDDPAARLAKELIGAPDGDRPGLLRRFTAGRGPEYTDALALAASRLEGDAQAKTREALANRLYPMQPKTLVEYLKDEDAEMRRAAARVCGLKRLRSSIPALVKLLRDPQESVMEAAHESLKTLAGVDLGTKPEPWEELLKKLGK